MYSQTAGTMPPYPEGEPGFMSILRNFQERRCHFAGPPRPGELDFRGGFVLTFAFPDSGGLLETALAAWNRFLALNHLPAAGKVPVKLEQAPELPREGWHREITAAGIRIAAGDTEGMRRAIYALIDRIAAAAAPSLPPEDIRRTPWLRHRISRCFFGPIKRPPFYRDELTDEVDYYPDGYLDRLASEGVNGLWLTGEWRELVHTDFFPDDPKREQRLEKLRRTVEKCRKYGIRIWLFCIEPKAWSQENPPPPGLRGAAASEQMYAMYPFCPKSPEGREYLRQAGYSLFSSVPGLGGLMMISVGERITSCLSFREDSDRLPECSKRCGLTAGGVGNTLLGALAGGMREAAPEAEILSWFYIPAAAVSDHWYHQLAEELTVPGVTLAFNFESGCQKTQCGQVHNGGDYWLSCVGPSDRFRLFTAKCAGHCAAAAKLQVGCSHECASVPFLPVPGQLYRKYRQMRELGVSSVIQCWYFGNFPGVMNRAAGALAFEDFQDDEEAFLTRLAAPEWGENDAHRVAEMWRELGRAYENYPLDNRMQYYGPLHDGPVWPLSLRLQRSRLTRSWKPERFPAGDAVGEMTGSFTLPDLEELTAKLSREWSAALADLPELRRRHAGDAEREGDFRLLEALDLIFASGAAILRFYRIRNRWFRTGDAALPAVLAELAEQERRRSLQLAEIAAADPRLGYHSEAEVSKFFPAKLRWRAGELARMLKEEFPRTAAGPAAWLTPPAHPEPAGTVRTENFAFRIHYLPAENEAELEITEVLPPPAGTLVDQFSLALADYLVEQDPCLQKFPAKPGKYRFPAGTRAGEGRPLLFSLTRISAGSAAEEQVVSYPPVPDRCDLRLCLHYFEPQDLAPVPGS